jgi:hypothetical protein
MFYNFDGKCWSANVRVNFRQGQGSGARPRNTGRPLTKGVLPFADLESRFYAVLSKAASK